MKDDELANLFEAVMKVVRDLQDENKELRRQLEQVQELLKHAEGKTLTIAELSSAAVERARTRATRYRAALEFYGNPDNWRDRNGGPPQAIMDEGEAARDALAKGKQS